MLSISLLIFSACNSDEIVNNNKGNFNIDTASFTYPFTIGSTWSYTRTYSAENIRPDSIRHYFSEYPIYGNGTITVLYDTVINGITTRCFLDVYTEYYPDTNTWHSRYYYGNYDSALVCYGYRWSGGGSGFPFSVNSSFKVQKYGKTFSNIKEVFRFIENGMPASDSVHMENPPVRVLKYPVVIGTEWLFKDIHSLSRIYKKYLSFENISIGVNQISCIKIQRDWEEFNDDFLYDYISKYGQMKRDYLVKDMIVTNEFGVTLGYVDMREMVGVTSFNIVNP
jgi:hypothetical protein